MKKLLLLTYLFAFISVFGQDKDIPFDKRLFQDQKTEFQEAIRNIKEGDFHFFDGSNADLTDALFHYLRAQEFNPYSSVLNFKIGVCYLYTNRKFKALDYLKFAYKVNPDVDENIRFYLAQAHQLNGDFERAIELYTEHKDGIRSGDQIQRLFINKKIKECKTGIELKESPVRVWIDNLGDSINSKYPEFSPVISADNRVLFYTARRPDSQGDKIDNTGYHYEDVYQSKRTFGTDWGNSTNVGGPVNTKSHDATVGLAPDGKSLIIYRGINAKNGDLYITRQQDDGSWEEPVSLGENINTKFHESSASLSFDEKTLYFVSDQPGGFGQHDIYVSNWDEEKQMWGEAENLGSTINTQFEEKGVFFHSDGRTLYFSSDGHNNMGGLDVFKTTLDPETGEWSTPENLGYPISTPDDDIYFVVTGDERYAYYSSFRQDGFGEKDIYKITFLGPKKEPLLADAKMIGSTPPLKKSPVLVNFFGAKETDIVADNSDENGSNDNKTDNDNSRPKVFILKGTISDCLTKQGIPATLSVTNERTGEKIKDLKANPDGTYTIALTPGDKYGLTASGNGYTIHSKTLSYVKWKQEALLPCVISTLILTNTIYVYKQVTSWIVW
jgi:tetratricopeptide (TPR) repeat protein